MKVSKILITTLVLIMGASMTAPAFVNGVHATGSPCSVSATPCLTIVPQVQTDLKPGSNVTFSVKTLNMPTFSGWDIAVKANSSVLNPLSLNVTELFGATFQAQTDCVKGSGLGCGENDGGDVVHSAGFSLGASDAGNVTLFTITYLVGFVSSTDLTYVNNPNEPSAVTDPSGFSLVDCSATPNQCVTASAGVASVPHFSLSAYPSSVSTSIGVASTSTITVSALNGFTADVALTTSDSACTLTPTTVTGGSGTSNLSCVFNSAGTVTVTITGTSGPLSQRAIVVYTVLFPPDFAISAYPQSISVTVGTIGTSKITISPIRGFTGDVALSTDNSACTLTPNTIIRGSGSSILSCPFTTAGSVNVTVTGTSGSLTQSTKVAVNVSALAIMMNCSSIGTVDTPVSCNATSSGGTAPLTFVWTATGGSSSSSNGSSFSTFYSAAGNYTISVTVTDSSTPQISQTQSTTVKITPLLPMLAGTTNQKTVFQFPSERAMFYAQGSTWIFFTNNQGGNVMPVYATSADGQTWTQYSIANIAGNSQIENASTPISAITNGTHVFLGYYMGSYGIIGKPIVIGIGKLTSGGTITWEMATIAVPATTGQRWYDPNLSINADGTLFLSYRNATSTNGGGFAFATSATPPYAVWSPPFVLRASADTWRTSWINLANGQEYVLYSPAGGCVRGRLYNGSFGNEEIICNPASSRYIAFGFNNGTNTPTVIYQESNTERLMITYRVGGVWGIPRFIGYAETNRLPQWTASFVPSLGKYYLIYYNYTSGTIWDYSGNANGWSRTMLLNSLRGNSTMSIISYPIAAEMTSQDMISFAWTTSDPNTNRLVDINFGAIVVGLARTSLVTESSNRSPAYFYQPPLYLTWILAAIVATILSTIMTKRKSWGT